MSMDYRTIETKDVPVSLPIAHSIYDYWGKKILKSGQKIPSYQEQSFLLTFPFFVLTQPNQEPRGYPCHQISLSHFSIDQQIGLIHDRISYFMHLKEPHAQLVQSVIFFAQHLLDLSSHDAVSTIEVILNKSHPSNALLNAMHCAVLVNLIGTELQISPEIRLSIACSALTMNWAIIDLQNELSSSTQQPTILQRNNILAHPTRAYKFLQSIGVKDEIWLKCCLHHHEEPDGRGYPQKLTFTQISSHSHLLRLVDRFVALVSSRVIRTGCTPLQAIKQLAGQPQAFPPEILQGLTQVVHLFYPTEISSPK